MPKLKHRISELEKLFKVDLRQPNRINLLVAIRSKIFNEFKHLGCYDLAKEFNVNHATVINSFKRFKNYNDNDYFKSVFDAIEKSDPSLVIKVCRREIKQESTIKAVFVPTVPKHKLPTNEKLMEVLRKNNESNLWNIEVTKWTFKNLKEFEKLSEQ